MLDYPFIRRIKFLCVLHVKQLCDLHKKPLYALLGFLLLRQVNAGIFFSMHKLK